MKINKQQLSNYRGIIHMQDNYTSFKIHSNYYAGILDVIEDLPEAEKNSILAEYFLAFHEYGNTRKIPTFKNKIAQGFFKTHLYSIDKSFADNDVYCASHDVGSYGGKQKAINAKIRTAEKKLQEAEKKLKELEAKAEAKAQQAEQLNTVKPEATDVEDNQPIANSDKLAHDQKQLKNIEKDDKTLDNKGISTGSQKEQTVSGSHQLQKTQQPQKRQQLQKEQPLTKQEKQKEQIRKIVNRLNWNTTAGLELSDEDKSKIVEIRLNNKKIKREQREYTQAALNLVLPEIKTSIDAGIPTQEIFAVWEGKGWIAWMHAWHAEKIARDIKAQSQTAKDLQRVQASQERVKNNDFNDLGEMTDTVREMLEISYKGRMNEINKGGN